MASTRLEIVIVEDHPPMCQGLELLLPHHGFRVTGSAGSAAAGARMIRARRPDVALVDLDLGDGSGTDLATTLIAEWPGTAIVLYTGSVDVAVLDDAATSGAYGLVLKTSPMERVADALRAAAAGRNYVDAALFGRLRARGARRISVREAQILGLLARGLTTRQIADELFLAADTVQTHVRNATRKLGARGRLHAVVLALAGGDLGRTASMR
ncbi:MAG TPA: response regulator transcription factor [Solirubrobacteraceae bacterium]|jgi:DNA-binding NarL/FixJ family response regulator|nr:response regulator transcription factor [Solirubrobacteraceae bacterium]